MSNMSEPTKFVRPKFATRLLRLVSNSVADLLVNLIRSLPIDPDRPLEVRIGEESKKRKPDQNAAMWAGVLRDIAEQAWVEGRQFAAEVWHDYFKREFLPDETVLRAEELAELVKDPATYKKWDYAPDGERVLVGSTTQLTVRGFAIYMREIEAVGAGKGVQFSAPPGRFE